MFQVQKYNFFSKLIVGVMIIILLTTTNRAQNEFEFNMGISLGNQKTYVVEETNNEDGYYIAFDSEIQSSIYIQQGDEFTITITDPNPTIDPNSFPLFDIVPLTNFRINYTIEIDDPENPGQTRQYNRRENVGLGELVEHTDWQEIIDYYDGLKNSLL